MPRGDAIARFDALGGIEASQTLGEQTPAIERGVRDWEPGSKWGGVGFVERDGAVPTWNVALGGWVWSWPSGRARVRREMVVLVPPGPLAVVRQAMISPASARVSV